MCTKALDSVPVALPPGQEEVHPNDQDDLPDRWCFGLSHPYIQRLIFLAGELERTADDP